jgi:hypothetical protein
MHGAFPLLFEMFSDIKLLFLIPWCSDLHLWYKIAFVCSGDMFQKYEDVKTTAVEDVKDIDIMILLCVDFDGHRNFIHSM